MPISKSNKVTQTTIKPEDCAVVATYSNKLFSPLIIEDSIYCVAENGDVLKFNSETSQKEIVFTILGQPSSIAYREAEEYFLVSDFAHQSIFSREDAKNQQITNLITEYDNRAFIGPNTLKVGPYSRNLYFTDSGPFLETSIDSCEGSVFVYSFDAENVKSLALRCLAFPSGIECDEEQKFLLVSETGKNRILKFNLNENLNSNYSTFFQFSGRFGPTAICGVENIFYVALFEFGELSNHGSVALLNSEGEMFEKYQIPVGPEITGIHIDQQSFQTISHSILVAQGNKIHKVTLKNSGNETESKLGDSIMLKGA